MVNIKSIHSWGLKKMKFKTIIALLVLISFVFTFSTVAASQDSHRKAAEELLRVSKADEMFKGIWKHLWKSVEQNFQRIDPPENIAPTIKQYKQKIFTLIEKSLGYDAIKEDLVTIYMTTYTEDEIRAISDFYKSEAGQKFLDKMPQLTQKSFAMTQRKQKEIIKEIVVLTKEMEEKIKEIEKQ
jgi:hypothetical protein